MVGNGNLFNNYSSNFYFKMLTTCVKLKYILFGELKTTTVCMLKAAQPACDEYSFIATYRGRGCSLCSVW